MSRKPRELQVEVVPVETTAEEVDRIWREVRRILTAADVEEPAAYATGSHHLYAPE